jgi:hypothetical protein
MTETKITKAKQVQIPLTPNFIRVGGEMLPISEFTADELDAIGREWTKKLIQRARDKKLQP